MNEAAQRAAEKMWDLILDENSRNDYVVALPSKRKITAIIKEHESAELKRLCAALADFEEKGNCENS